jgi:anaerobic selenocysteine-containing dehydrogenase
MLQELGAVSILDDPSPDPWAKWRHMLQRGAGVELADLQASGEPAVLPAPEPGEFFAKQVWTADGRVDCCPPSFAGAIDRCHELFADAAADTGRLLLIHGRDPWMHNTWFANVPRMKRGGRTSNPLCVSPRDAESLGVRAGDRVLVTSDHGEIEADVAVDDELMSGVVSMVHGWGHAVSPRLRVAAENPGSNPNMLLPSGPGSYEPLSSQAHMTGIPVTVRPVTAAAGHRRSRSGRHRHPSDQG